MSKKKTRIYLDILITKLTIEIFSLQNKIFSMFSGKSLFLSFERMSPAVENNLSTSVDVGGGVRNLFATFAKTSFAFNVVFSSYSFQNFKQHEDVGLSKYSFKTSFANLEVGFLDLVFCDCAMIVCIIEENPVFLIDVVFITGVVSFWLKMDCLFPKKLVF